LRYTAGVTVDERSARQAPGTHRLRVRAGAARRLAHAGGADDATSGLVCDWAGLERAAPRELAVFRGDAWRDASWRDASWRDASGRAVIHRSPPADGVRRVVITFDWLA
jgi:hypothetical protein